ncbi:hypothetical protein Nepgr_003398 [Nepenthes gracilis]|uniref:Uncharacterized protein n=1 Tax=Nepenthes gracilis TaxID=150966 RepID=A0AAD3XDI0_NEPGR|nr:hypothetical protein Nepgr_003398 [Nepenthes gracilis]
MMHEAIGVPACFSTGEKLPDDQASIAHSPQSLAMSVYRTEIAKQSRLVTITWCKNLLLHGLSVSVDGPDGDHHYHCKVELKPWYFWRKQGSKHFTVDGKTVDVVWDLKAAKFNGEVEPQSDYYIAIVSEEEVVLVVGDLKKDAFRKTGCRPALNDPVLVSRKVHMFGKKKFSTRIKFHEREKSHEISVECRGNGVINKGDFDGFSPEMEIRIDGEIASRVKHLQWKFRGNELIDVNKRRVEVYWDVHDWLFASGLRNAMFLFKPSSSSSSSSSTSSMLSTDGDDHASEENHNLHGLPELCLFLYAWKVE